MRGRRRPAPAQPDAWRNWHVPLSHSRTTLKAAYDSLSAISLRQREVPLMVQLVENPRFDLPGVEIFSGATNLRMEVSEVSGHGPLAYQSGTYEMDVKPASGPSSRDRGKYLFIARRMNTVWRYEYKVWNSDLPQAGN